MHRQKNKAKREIEIKRDRRMTTRHSRNNRTTEKMHEERKAEESS
jgi:hypothetical protein